MSTVTVESLKQVLTNHGINCEGFDLRVDGQVVSLVGEMTVNNCSLVNIVLENYLDEQKASFEVSRSGLKLYRPTASKDAQKYQLSPNDEDLTEFYDSEEHLKLKVRWLAKQFWLANHAVMYTGAGISTAAKIPDFRGPDGVWTRRDRGLAGPKGVAIEQAIPTYAHNCIVKMFEQNLVAYLTSQNVDGLHRRSGVTADQMSELHGNCYKEICASCKAEFLRTYDVCSHRGEHFRKVKDTLSQSGISHITGRKCESCGEGMLRDSIIHFGENLPELDLDRGIENAKKSDFAFCVGTSLRVSPACNLPELVRKRKGKMAILNLQGTGKDEQALRSGGVIIHHKIDKVFEMLVKELGIEFPREKDPEDPEDPCFEEDQAMLKNVSAKQEPVKPVAKPRPITVNVLPAEFFIGNTVKPVENNPKNFEWTFFVSSDANEVKSCSTFLKNVTVHLHPTFTPSEIKLNPAEEKSLELTRIGWGTFSIKVSVEFLEEFNREPMEFVHSLNFNGRTVTSCKIPPKAAPSGLFSGLGNMISALKPTRTAVRDESGRIHVEDKASRAEQVALSSRLAGKSDFQVRVVHDDDGHAHIQVEE